MSTIEATIPVEILELSPYAPTRSTIAATPLSAEELRKTEAYWRVCNYLSLGMIYLQQNPLLEEPLRPEQSRTGCSAIGDPARIVVYLRSSEPADQEVRPRRDFSRRSRARRAGRSWSDLPRRTYSEIYPEKSQDVACASFSNSSPSLAGSAATAPPRRRGQSMKAENSATCSRMPVGPPSTIPNLSWPRRWATENRGEGENPTLGPQ